MNGNFAQVHASVRDDVTQWFFDDYLRTWIGVGAGTTARGPEFILDYWSAPLYWSDEEGGRWLPDAPAVIAQLAELQTRLRAEGYAHTAVPDHRVTVYHRNGAAIEVIWSRLRADGTEIERVAAHFEISRGPRGWRILGVQATSMSGDSLNTIWPQANSQQDEKRRS